MKHRSLSSSSSSTSSPFLPPPPSAASASSRVAAAPSHYRSSSTGSAGGAATGFTATSSAPLTSTSSTYAQSLVTSMTIDEMRELHRRAQRDADAKRTELRLVLASRYRELVGSSDQVLKMKARSHELHELLRGVPSLLHKLEASLQDQVSMQERLLAQQQQLQQSHESDEGGAPNDNVHKLFQGPGDRPTASLATPMTLRHHLSVLPRLLHRNLDQHNVHAAALQLLELMALIASHTTSEYPLANALARTRQRLVEAGAVQPLGVASAAAGAAENDQEGPAAEADEETAAQIRMVYFMVETLPQKIHGTALRILEAGGTGQAPPHRSEAADPGDASTPGLRYGAEVAASSLSALDLLAIPTPADNRARDGEAASLVDTYYQCKSKRLLKLVERLSRSADSNVSPEGGKDNEAGAAKTAPAAPPLLSTAEAESILSQIVLLIQYECILHPYQIFCKRQFPWTHNSDHAVMNCLPVFDAGHVQARCSKFLATHLPLVRSKAKSILGIIAGTTASALGQIRQSLYDKTDGIECIDALNRNGGGSPGSWYEAVSGMVEERLVSEYGSGSDGSGGGGVGRSGGGTSLLATDDHRHRRFSLWSALFSGTFSSLVHSILTSAFASVHTSVVSTLQSSLRNAPDWSGIMPHEAHRNTLRMATGLNEALLKLSDDAHELLVHAEERVESERRLRQSLYVQTCEILGRLLCELRCMVMARPGSGGTGTTSKKGDDDAGATRDLIVGRLCVLLKFRLSSLSKLLDPSASPASMHSASGMISHIDLQSAFDLADDDEDGLVGFDEALEAMEAAFSGTSWRGAQLVRETLLVADNRGSLSKSSSHGAPSPTVANVTLNELTLLGARGLRHDTTGPRSALGVFQASLDDIVNRCFERWAGTALSPSTALFESTLSDFMTTASSVDDAEWLRLHGAGSTGSPASIAAAESVSGVSPHVLCLLLDASSIFNRTTCPADFLPPVPSIEYAYSLGISCDSLGMIATLSDRLRVALLRQALDAMTSSFARHVSGSEASSIGKMGGLALAQLVVDVAFVARLDEEGTSAASGSESTSAVAIQSKALSDVRSQVRRAFQARGGHSSDKTLLSETQTRAMDLCSLYLSSLVGENLLSSASSSAVELDSRSGSSSPMLRAPLRSTTRFVLLPVQADRTSTDVQLRSKYSKAKDSSTSNRPETSSGGVMSSGLGFLSSMLKKN